MHIIDNLRRLFYLNFLNHDLGSRTFLNHEHLHQLLLIDLQRKLFNFIICQYMLHLPAAY